MKPEEKGYTILVILTNHGAENLSFRPAGFSSGKSAEGGVFDLPRQGKHT